MRVAVSVLFCFAFYLAAPVVGAVGQQQLPQSAIGYWCGDEGNEVEIQANRLVIGAQGEPADCSVVRAHRSAFRTSGFASCTGEGGAGPMSFRLSLNRMRLTLETSFGRGTWQTSHLLRCSPASGHAPAEGVYFEIKLDADFPGGDLHNYRNVPRETCESFCSGDSRCVGYSYVQSQKWCWLKSSLGALHHSSAVTSGVKMRPSPTVAARQSFDTRGGYDYPGGDFNHLPDIDRAQCEQFCARDERCVAYSHISSRNACWLKSTLFPPRPDADVTSGIKSRAP